VKLVWYNKIRLRYRHRRFPPDWIRKVETDPSSGWTVEGEIERVKAVETPACVPEVARPQLEIRLADRDEAILVSRESRSSPGTAPGAVKATERREKRRHRRCWTAAYLLEKGSRHDIAAKRWVIDDGAMKGMS